jgi:hypothetical protein
MTTPIFVWGAVPSPSTFGYAPFGISASWNGAITARQGQTAISGAIGNLTVSSPIAISTNYYTNTLYVNSNPTSLVCSVGVGGTNLGTTTFCADNAHSVTVNSGDLVTVRSDVPGGAATTYTAAPRVSATITSVNGQEQWLPLWLGIPSATAINYVGLAAAASATEGLVSFVVADPGAITGLRGYLEGTAAGAGKWWQFTVFQNGVATAIIAGDSANCGGASSLQCFDYAHSITVAAGDVISVQICPTATSALGTGCPVSALGAPAAANIALGLRFVPANANHGLLFTVPVTLPPVSVANNFLAATGNLGAGTTEALGQVVAPVNMTVGGLFATQCPGPGAAVTRSVTLRSNGVSQSPTVIVPSGATACPTLSPAPQDNTHTYSVPSGALLDELTLLNTVTGAATVTEFKTGMWGTVP